MESEGTVSSSLCKKVLFDTRLFTEPSGELKGVFDLQTSAKECFLFASYAARLHGFYLYEGERLLRAVGDDEALTFPWLPFSLVHTRDLEAFYSQPSLSPSDWIEYTSLELARRDPDLSKARLSGSKYVKLLPPIDEMDASRYAPSTFRGHVKGVFKNLEALIGDCTRLGVRPSDVFVLFQNPLDDEGFYQYLAGVQLRKLNYLVTERPLGVSLEADIYGYRGREFSNGAFLLELSIGLGSIGGEGDNEESAAIVEAEKTPSLTADSSSTNGVGQALRYLDAARGYFGKAFVSGPLVPHLVEQESHSSTVGVVTFDADGRILFKDASGMGRREQEAEVVDEARNLLVFSRARSRLSFEDGEIRIRIT